MSFIGWKTLWEKKEMLLTSIFSFPIFKRFFPKGIIDLTSILKVLHGNTKSPTGCMYSWRYNILLEVKEGI